MGNFAVKRPGGIDKTPELKQGREEFRRAETTLKTIINIIGFTTA
jgi:hypothetical protein